MTERTTRATGRGLHTWTGLSPLLRLLILTQLAFNIGFFAVLPVLAEHLGTAIGLAGWMVGLVLGVRTFSQQGLFVVGGALADRYGVRPVVLAGCVLRIAGFVWLGYAAQTWAVIGAVLLIGFAAALFSPAVESEVARQAVLREESGGGSRTNVLALFTVAGQAGAFVGPLLGAALLAVDFRAVCLAGAGVFVLVLAGHFRLLPQHIPGRVRVRARACSEFPVVRAKPGRSARGGAAGVCSRCVPSACGVAGHVAEPPVLRRRAPRVRAGRRCAGGELRTGSGGGLRSLTRNGRFLALCCAYGTYLLAYNQLYLILPDEVERTSGSQAPLAWLFALSSLLVVTTQLPVTRWAAHRLDLRRSMRAGLLLIAAGFGVVAAARPAGWTGTVGLLPAAGFAVLLTLGQMLVAPAARAWVPDLAEEGRLGLYTGAMSSVSGLIVLVGSSATGSLLDTELPPAVPWLVLAAIPVASVALLPRRR